MTFRSGASGDSNVSGGGGGRGLAIGGGIGGIAVVLIGLLFGVDTSSILGGGGAGGADQTAAGRMDRRIQECERDSATANNDDVCRIVWASISLDEVWADTLPAQAGKQYQKPRVTIFSGRVDTGCGAASSDIGPFYCPADKVAYFDTDFFQVMQRRLGGRDEPAAQMYVVAHEYGHHLQTLLGDIRRSQQDPRGPASGAVRVELQADCYAGVWFHHATRQKRPDGQAPLLQPLTERQYDDIVVTAEAIGDDHIQQVSGRRVDSSTFTHGTSRQRRQWFINGYQSGDLRGCNTFDAQL